MAMLELPPDAEARSDYSVPRRTAWTAFALVFTLMLMDYIDRQIIVSMFPHLKAEFGLSDTELGALVSIVALTVGVGAFPAAIVIDRWSRTRAIVVMGSIWSLATMACGLAQHYLHLFVARSFIGVGEAGYGPAGGALLSTYFPTRIRAFILGAFQAAAGIGAVLGVLLGGFIATHWGWRSAFGVVGIPGLVVALLFLLLPDYKTVDLRAGSAAPARRSLRDVVGAMWHELRGSPTAVLAALGGAMQLAVMASMATWLPTYFNRVAGAPTDRAGAMAAVVILALSIGAAVWGALIDRFGRRTPRRKLQSLVGLCLLTMAIFVFAFGELPAGDAQFRLIVLGGALASATLGTVLAIAVDVIHPSFRATAVAFVALVGNLGLAGGPFIAGLLSDAWGLQRALALLPLAGVGAAALFWRASCTYDTDARRAAARIAVPTAA